MPVLTAVVAKNLQIDWTWGVAQGGDLSSIKGFKVAITPQGEDPNSSSVLNAITGPDDRSYIFNSVILQEKTYTAWVQAIYLGKDSPWVSSGNITIVDDGVGTISNSTLTVDNIKDGANWSTLPEDGANVTQNHTSNDTSNVDGVPSTVVGPSASSAWRNGFEAGAEFDKWTAATNHTLTAEGTLTYSGSQSAKITTSVKDTDASGSIGGVYAAIPEELALQFGGRRVLVRCYAMSPSVGGATEFEMAYSTADTGNSTWKNTAITPNDSWAAYSFEYDVPAPNTGGVDYIGFQGDGASGIVYIDNVEIVVLPDWANVSDYNGTKPADNATVGATWDAATGNITGRPTDSELLNYIVPQGVFQNVALPYTSQHVYIPALVQSHGTAYYYKVFEAELSVDYASAQFHGTVKWGRMGGRYEEKAEVTIALNVTTPHTTIGWERFSFAGDDPTANADARLYVTKHQNASSHWVLTVWVYLETWREMFLDGAWFVAKSGQATFINDKQIAADGGYASRPFDLDDDGEGPDTGTHEELVLTQEYAIGADNTYNAINFPESFEIPTGTVNVGDDGTVKTDNYVSGVSGWAIDGTGKAEFNDVVVRGLITGTNVIGSTFRSQDDLFLIDATNKIITIKETAVSPPAAYNPALSYAPNATTFYANEIWKNLTGLTIGPEPWDQAKWTAQTTYVELTPGELTFFYGGAAYSSVKRIDSGFQTPDSAVTFDPPFLSTPVVTLSIGDLLTYKASSSAYDQNLSLSRGTVTATTFTPTATLKKGDGNLDLTTGLVSWVAVEGGGGDPGCPCNCNYACTCNCAYSCVCDCAYNCVCNCAYACTCNCNYPCVCNCNYSDENLKTNIVYI